MNLTNPFIELGKQRGLQQGRQEELQQGLQQGLQRGLQQGLQQGHQQGEAELVLKQLRRRLGTLSISQAKTVRKLPIRNIEALGEALLDFTSLADLTRWLRNNKNR